MTPAALETWLVEQLATRLKVQKDEIDPERPVEEYGIDSMEAVALTGQLEDFLAKTVPPTAIWDYPSLRALAHYLAQQDS